MTASRICQTARQTVAAWTISLLFAGSLAAEVSLPKIFTSHMVLQRDKPVIIWGWAQPGESVSVQILNEKKVSKANDKGEWKVTLAPLKIGEPFEVTVSGSNTIKLEDVLVGDVWVCSGQSNMEMGIKQCLNAEAEIAAANYPKIRLFLIPKTTSPTPNKDVDALWKVCTPETVVEGGWGGFSAAAYYFGREIHKTQNVPVGLIATSWGGTRIEPWTPPEGFGLVPALQKIYNLVMLSNPRTTLHKQRLDQLVKETESWLDAARKSLNEETMVPAMPVPPPEMMQMPTGPGAPTTLYNGMIYPIVPFAIRGAIWYQGESNHTEKDYAEKTKALVAGWRKVWGQDEFPFFYVQIAPFIYGSENPAVLAEFWEQQANALAIPNTGMAVIHDVGDLKDIHPKNKQEVGRRLALLALAKTYGQANLVCSGPTFKAMAIEGNQIRVTFDNVGGGLAARDGKPLNWFEVIDADEGGFVKAQAEISGSSVLVSAPEVKKPVSVRFGWHKLAEPNLMNKEGLPAVQFRAGTEPARDFLTQRVPEAKDYALVYDLDLAKVGPKTVYTVDNRAQITKPFDRIAYFLELQAGSGDVQYVYVSVDAFTKELGKIGVPTAETKAFFQQDLTNMNVLSNVKGVVTGVGLTGGNIEFWPHNYGPVNSKKVANASEQLYDFGDQPTDPVDGYGSMQIHNHEAKQTIFAFNNFRGGPGADLGIGNAPTGNPDWTFAKNAGNYSVKRLRVLVHCK
ncbi:MAG: sialate O-acetylesterase [Verrucomicrobiota bacterium]